MTSDTEIDPELKQVMNDIGRILSYAVGDQWGFFLAVYPFGEGGRFNYISNSNRRDVIILLKEMTARFEGQPAMKGTA